ncbi:pectinesterase inhibitor-like [Henckelia pumila]|uniref:pectinesterase inhibitor-like n=1 Tax=Henckelia pumila TaxID=405737 RepID=UPI003C6E6CC2
MVFSCPKNCSIIFVSLSLFLLIDAQAIHVNFDDDGPADLCPKTRNSTFCFQIIGSFGNDSFMEMMKAAIKSASQLAELAADQARELLIQGKYPALNDQLKSCIGNYTQTNLDLFTMQRDLKAGYYDSLPPEANAVLADAGACDSQFQPPSSEPAEVKKGTQDLLDACSLVLVVSQIVYEPSRVEPDS